MIATEQYLSLKDLARHLNFSRSFVYKAWPLWAASGLRYYRIGKTPRFRAKDVDSFMEKKRMVTV